jgi:hypothetical protein
MWNNRVIAFCLCLSVFLFSCVSKEDKAKNLIINHLEKNSSDKISILDLKLHERPMTIEDDSIFYFNCLKAANELAFFCVKSRNSLKSSSLKELKDNVIEIMPVYVRFTKNMSEAIKRKSSYSTNGIICYEISVDYKSEKKDSEIEKAVFIANKDLSEIILTKFNWVGKEELAFLLFNLSPEDLIKGEKEMVRQVKASNRDDIEKLVKISIEAITSLAETARLTPNKYTCYISELKSIIE